MFINGTTSMGISRQGISRLDTSIGTSRGKRQKGPMRRSEFSLENHPEEFKKVELELGASDDENNKYTYSVYDGTYQNPTQKKFIDNDIPMAGEIIRPKKKRYQNNKRDSSSSHDN